MFGYGICNMLLSKFIKVLDQESILRIFQVITMLESQNSSHFIKIEILEVWFKSHTPVSRIRVT